MAQEQWLTKCTRATVLSGRPSSAATSASQAVPTSLSSFAGQVRKRRAQMIHFAGRLPGRIGRLLAKLWLISRWRVWRGPAWEIVLDPFAGFGTTSSAAKSLSLQFTLVEREQQHCRTARERLGSVHDNTSPFSRSIPPGI
jgi:hypothetical protein